MNMYRRVRLILFAVLIFIVTAVLWSPEGTTNHQRASGMVLLLLSAPVSMGLIWFAIWNRTPWWALLLFAVPAGLVCDLMVPTISATAQPWLKIVALSCIAFGLLYLQWRLNRERPATSSKT